MVDCLEEYIRTEQPTGRGKRNMIRVETTLFTRRAGSLGHVRALRARELTSPSSESQVADFSENWTGHSPGNTYGRSSVHLHAARITRTSRNQAIREKISSGEGSNI